MCLVEVQNRKEIFEKIIPFFNENSPKIQSRKKDFELFRQIAGLLKKDSVDLQKIQGLKKQMHWGLAAYGKSVSAVGIPSSSKE